jgi:murein L,D-transpeptidase YafK
MRRKPFFALLLFAMVAAGLLFRFWPHQPLAAGAKADKILVVKSERSLSLMKNGAVIASYRVALGGNPLGHKVEEWDGRTPEGQYVINGTNEGSRFYRSLHISYPSTADRQRAARAGHKPGKDIMVHGIKNGFGWLGRFHRLVDWTDGCIAVTNEEMADIWRAVPSGTPIEIRS